MDDSVPPQPEPEAGRRSTRATVLVCTSGRQELLLECLRSLAAALGPTDELLVVEAVSRSAGQVIAKLGEGPWRALHLDQPGKCRQLNAGIEAARGAIVVVTDDDCRVAPDWVERMVSPFAEPDVGIAFGPVRGLSEIPGAVVSAAKHPPGPGSPELWTYAHGAALAARVAAVREAGGFDERLGPGAPVAGGEEGDLVRRLWRTGWRSWIADAPTVDHVEWRTEAQDRRNRLVYEQGAGSWLGAGLRQEPGRAASLLRRRLRYQAGLFRTPGARSHAPRALAAFAGGLVRGVRREPRRFLDPPRQFDSIPFFSRPHALDALPWPPVSGRRCLVLTPGGGSLAAELRRRGAGEVVELRSAADSIAAGLGDAEPFDLVACDGLLAASSERESTLAAVRSVCSGFLLSAEPIDPVLSMLARRRPRARSLRSGELVWLPNGAAHRRLLEAAGFEVRAVSAPYWVESTPEGPVRRPFGLCELTRTLGSVRPARLPRRAILCRASSP